MAMRVARRARDTQRTSSSLRRYALLAAAWAAILQASCETNHAALEKKPTGGHEGGAPGVGGAPSGSGLTSGSGGNAPTAGGHADDEPPGTSRLTIVNGVVDAPTVVVCLGKVASDGSVAPFGEPIATLDYARSTVLPDLAHVDLAEDTLQPLLIAGDLKLVDGLDCAAAVELARNTEAPLAPPSDASTAGAAGAAAEGAAAGATQSEQGGGAGVSNAAAGAAATDEGGATGDGSSAGEGGSAGSGGGAPPAVRSALRVRGLPAIPAGTLDQGRSLALVANGCMGGATYGGSYAEDYCGPGFSENAPTLSAVLVDLSRVISLSHVGLQVVHASLATGAIDVNTIPPPPQPGSGVTIVTNVSVGQVAPRPASTVYTADDLKSATRFNVSVSSQGRALFSEPWSTVLDNGGLSELDVAHTYALVFSGPRGDLPAVPELWNAAALTAIPVDED